MKKICFSILVLSLLLAILTACGAQAKQPDEPEPAPQVTQTEPAQPEQSAEPAPEPIADIEPMAEPEPIAAVEPEPEPAPENPLTFTDCNEIVYATSQVNLRSGPSTDYDKVGSLNGGDSITRTGIGTGDYSSWSRVILSDGTEVYVNNGYISTTKPVQQQQQTKPSGGGSTTTSKSSGNTQTSTPSSTPSGGSSEQQWLTENGQGLAGLAGYVSPQGAFEEGAGEGVEGDSRVAVNMN